MWKMEWEAVITGTPTSTGDRDQDEWMNRTLKKRSGLCELSAAIK